MKRAEIDRLPEAISRTTVQELLRILGLEPNDVFAVHIYPTYVNIDVLATDDNGRKIVAEGHMVARHSITFKVKW